MQKRKIEDSKVFEAYRRLIEGESLSKVAAAEEINLNRGTLRKYIELVVVPNLTKQEKQEFEQLMSGNFRGNSTKNKRKNRNGKRAQAAARLEKSGAIQELASRGVTPQQIEDLYNRLGSDKHTTISRDTYIYKCLEHLNVLREIGFTTEEAFSFFMRRPKLFSGTSEKIKDIYEKLIKIYGSSAAALQILNEDPFIDLRMQADKKQVEERGDR